SPSNPGVIAWHAGSAITLRYRERHVSVDLAGVNFVPPAAAVYRYALSSLEHGGIAPGNQRSINFAYLPIGTHRLQVQASTDPAVWGTGSAVLTIVVLPPWWLTKTAYAVYVVLALSLAYGVFRFFHRRAQLKNRQYVEKLMRE